MDVFQASAQEIENKIAGTFTGEETSPLTKKSALSFKDQSNISNSTIEQILDFQELIGRYFDDQARDYVQMLENTSTKTKLLTDKLAVLEILTEIDPQANHVLS